jgi:protease IV
MRGQNAEMFDLFTAFTQPQAQLFHQQLLGGTYQYFLKIVAQQRHLTVAQVNDIAQGRVWIGEEAVKNKLIDQVGGFDAALKQAKVLANLDPDQEVQLVELPGQPGILTRLLTGRIYGKAAVSSELPRGLEPLLWVARAALANREMAGQAYCPLVPVL